MRASAALRSFARATARSPAMRWTPPARALRIAGAVLAAAVLVFAGYHFWLRNSGLVAVDSASVIGLTTKDAGRIRAELTEAARGMTTLNFSVEDLRRAVSDYPVVKGVEAEADFPHALRITVIEHDPVAALVVDGKPKVAIAADGTLLRGLALDDPLALLRPERAPRGERLTDSEALGALRVVTAAPAPLASRIAAVEKRPARGLVAQVRRGPEIVFGDLSGLEAKWAAAASALAHPTTAGATYIDVRLPERPVAGGLGPLPSAAEDAGPPAGRSPAPAPAPGPDAAADPPAAAGDPAQAAESAPGANPQPKIENSPTLDP